MSLLEGKVDEAIPRIQAVRRLGYIQVFQLTIRFRRHMFRPSFATGKLL